MNSVIPYNYDIAAKQKTGRLNQALSVEALEVKVYPKIQKSSYGPGAGDVYTEFELPMDGLYDFADGFIEIWAQPTNTATAQTFVRFADWIGSIFQEIRVGTDSEELRVFEHFGSTMKFVKAIRDEKEQQDIQGYIFEGRGTAAQRNTNAGSQKRYTLPYYLPELTECKWPMNLLAEPLKLKFTWRDPRSCCETDNVATGVLTYTISKMILHCHKIQGDEYVRYYNAMLKQNGSLKYTIPHWLRVDQPWTTAVQDIPYNRRAANIRDFIVKFRKIADLTDATKLDKDTTFYKSTLKTYQLQYTTTKYPPDPIDCSTTDNQEAYLYLLRMVGVWDGEKGVGALSTKYGLSDGTHSWLLNFSDDGAGGSTAFVAVVNIEEHGDQTLVSGLNNKSGNQDIIVHLTGTANPTAGLQAEMMAMCDLGFALNYNSGDGKVHISSYF